MLDKLLFVALGVSMSFLCASASAAQKDHPKIKVRILAPQASNTLSGTVEVRATFTPGPGAKMPTQALVGFDGPPWVKMSHDGSEGAWKGSIDTTMVPNGSQRLTVVSDERYGRGGIDVTVTNALKCFFADLHAHSSYSDGTMVPEAAFDYARNTTLLDVFALTDHLEKLTDAEWADVREQADKANQEGRFVTLPAMEWTKALGHACIFDPKTRLWPTNLEAFYQAAADANVIVKFNHPGTGTNVFNALAYSEVGDKAVELMEVRRSEEEQAYIRALNLGWHLGPDGSDDTHSPNWGKTRAWTGIWAPGLSRRNIWEALKARRTFSSTDRNCRLLFRANDAEMGTILAEPVSSLNVTVAVEDPDANDKTAKIALFQDGQVIETTEPGTAAAQWSRKVDVKPGPHYWFVKVTQADTNFVWSAPIWATGKAAE